MNKDKGGVSFLGLLQIVLIFLKLTNKIDMSWLIVLAPIWLSTLIIALTFLVACIKINKR